MLMDAVLDLFFGGLELVHGMVDAAAPNPDLAGVMGHLDQFASGLAFANQFVHLGVGATVAGIIVSVEVFMLTAKTGLKLWRLLPFT